MARPVSGMSASRYATEIARLNEAVFEGPGELNPALRTAVGRRAAEIGRATASSVSLPEALLPYVDKVALHAYKVVDEDVEALRTAGYSEDEIFEVTVSAAVGAGLERLESGLGALHEAG